jgi:phage tail-like protein
LANGSSRSMDPPFAGGFIFNVEAVGEIGAFTECAGLSAEVEIEEIKEGGQNHFAHKLPGRMKWPNIVFKRGITDADNLFEWFQKASGEGFAGEGNMLARSSGEIALVDSQGRTVRKWEFEEAFPVKWTGPSLSAAANAPSVEELEIAHHGFRASSG